MSPRLQAIAARRAALHEEAAATRAEIILAARHARSDAALALLGLAASRLLARRPLLASLAAAGMAMWTAWRGKRSGRTRPEGI